MGPTRWGSDDDPERTEVVPQRAARQLPPRNVDPDKTVVIAPSHGAPDETTTPVAPGYPPAPSGYPVGAYHQQLGRYPAPSAPIPPAQRGRGWLWAVLAIGAVALSAVAVLLVLRVGPIKSLTADKLNIAAAQAGVRNVLADPTTGYGLTTVKDVTCNHGVDPTIFKGATFTCDLTINGHKAQATITFIDDDGTYSVGRPE
ncbi:MAG: DUF4333 domain-containing protein [Mycobacterium sp.]|uniref:DUF4333 domain-containing protein n=1 Tax=Mycobacterium sp. TaxID=1785 RepID=UPI003BAF9A04